MEAIKGFSVIVCCYNSATRLPETLRHLTYQEINNNLQWEIIIVDNGSTDNTSTIALNEWSKYLTPNVGFTIVLEIKPGLSFAREKGVSLSRFNNIIFCDDDNLLAPDYIIQADKLLTKYTEFGIFGGNNKYESGLKNFITENYISDFAIGEQATEEITDLTSTRGFVWGAGMILRKLVLDDLKQKKFTSSLNDRKGTQLNSGGDSEICFAARLLGWKIGASSLLNLTHNVPKERFCLDYIIKLKIGFGQADPFLSAYHIAWLYKKGNKPAYKYKREINKYLFPLFNHKKSLLLYLTGQKRCTKDFIELNYYLSALKTILTFRSILEKQFMKLVVEY